LPSLERAPESSIVLTASDVAELGEGRAIVFDAVLGEARARAIAGALFARSGELRPAAVGSGSERKVEPAVRGDSIAWLEREADGPLADLWRLLDGLRAELAQRAWLTLDDCEVQLARYLPGASYSRHLDAFAHGGRRRVSVLYYLNTWTAGDGGELRVHEPEGPREIAPELDRLVLFLSERVEHEVRDTRTTRSAVTAWMLGP
jgi:SM-20-related protein